MKSNNISTRFYYSAPIEIKKITGIFINGALSNYSKIPGSKVEFAPRITICSLLNKEDGTLRFGVSRCSPKDGFSRKKGAKLAMERAINDPYIVVSSITKNTNVSNISKPIVDSIFTEFFNMEYPITF